jgi:hypothetical protein
MIKPIVPSDAPLLSVALNNWTSINRELLNDCLYDYGTAGQQIRDQRSIPLKPFASEPNALDPQINPITLEPIPGTFRYHRAPLDKEQEAALTKLIRTTSSEAGKQLSEAPGCIESQLPMLIAEAVNQERLKFFSTIPLSATGLTDQRKDQQTYAQSLSARELQDAALHKRLVLRMSPESRVAIESHSNFAAYTSAPLDKRSLLYYFMAQSIHKTGDASTKYKRTQALIMDSQGADSFENFSSRLNINFAQFVDDFESSQHPGYISLKELKSFLFLKGCNRNQFQRLFDEQLRANPSGRFDNPDQLQEIFQQFVNNNKMSFSDDPVSSQLSAFVAGGKQPSPPIFPSETRPSRPKTNPSPCSFCQKELSKDHYGHLAVNCHRNPSNKQAKSLLVSAPSLEVSLSTRMDSIESSLGALASFLATLNPSGTVADA